MGTHNRERRRQKQRERERRQRLRDAGGSSSPPHGEGLGIPAAIALSLAVDAAREGADHARALAADLACGVAVAGGRPAVATEIRAALEDVLAWLAEHGWQPDEVARMSRRRAGAAAARMATRSMREARRRQPHLAKRWGAPRDLASDEPMLDPGQDSFADEVEQAVILLATLRGLPRLPEAEVAENGAEPDANQRILARVRALLAKAEATGFAEEADAFTTKAHELLNRHAIDRALLDGAGAGTRRRLASLRRIWIDEPYAQAKAYLLSEVARANRCRVVHLGGIDLCVVAGHNDDLDTTELLFTSLLVQATTQLAALGSRNAASARTRSRSFRQSFLVGFAARIGHRLEEAGRACEAEAGREHGALVPVLAARRSAAEEAAAAAFPRARPSHISCNDRAGRVAGALAADLASIAVQPELSGFPEAAAAAG